MILQIITTYLLTVNGSAYLPQDYSLTCTCVKHSRSVTCNINNLITTRGELKKIVVVSGPDGEVVQDRVTVTCHD